MNALDVPGQFRFRRLTQGDPRGLDHLETTMETKTYTAKNDAIRAARDLLRQAGVKDPMSGVHFRLDQVGEEWAWHQMDVGTGQQALGELIADGVDPNPAKPLPPVKVIPRKGKAAPKAKAPAKPATPAKETRDEKRLRLIKEADARNAAKANAPKSPKAPRAPGAAAKGATPSKKAEALAAAQRGEMPTPPDFSAETHKRFRKTLEQLVDFAKAGNVKGLRADKTQPLSSSRVALCRYRDLAIAALEAKAKAAKAAAKIAA